MILLTDEIRAKLLPLYSQEGDDDDPSRRGEAQTLPLAETP